MATRVLLTVDTELRWDRHVSGASWQENLALSFDPAGVGVGYQLGRLAAHGLKACFFVDPMPALVYGIEPIRLMVGHPGRPGSQLHLTLVADGIPVRRPASTDRPSQSSAPPGPSVGPERPSVAFFGELSRRHGDPRSVAATGIRYDSSHNGSHHPDPSALPLDPRRIAPALLEGLVEIPVTQIEHRPGRLRHLQICAVSFDEMRAALIHAADEDHPVVAIVGHSFELATRGGERPNPVLARGREMCGFSPQFERLPTARFSDLATDLGQSLPAASARSDRPGWPAKLANRSRTHLSERSLRTRIPRASMGPDPASPELSLSQTRNGHP